MKITRIGLAYGSLIIAAAMLMMHLDVSDGTALIVTIGLAVIALTHMRRASRQSCESAS
ncbi:hypothetical protein [Qipengyuania mesophila]|uniref:hypothetical protein n=1 Tax=Qipengyuania mesophila TaxID=2867246 RepID=UPI003513E1B7